MHSYTKKLGPSGDAWDVYFIYGPDARWQDGPANPDYWMRQLGREVPAPGLDGAAFAKEALAPIGRRRPQ